MQHEAAKRLRLVAILLIGAILACNLPGRDAQVTPSEPTPNMTMTALFSIVTKAPVISTPVAPAATATNCPGSYQYPSSNCQPDHRPYPAAIGHSHTAAHFRTSPGG